MCGRYAQAMSGDELAEEFQIIRGPTPPEVIPSWNVAPTQRAPVVGLSNGERAVRLHRWGLVPRWATDAKGGARAINARADGVADRAMFRAAFAKRRCLVPATGFYEWQETDDGRVPQYVYPARSAAFAFAGLWEAWKPPAGGDALRSFTIVTTAPNELLRAIHDRMPVILPPSVWALWLDPDASPEALQALLASVPVTPMKVHAVSARVNSPANDDPSLIEPDNAAE